MLHKLLSLPIHNKYHQSTISQTNNTHMLTFTQLRDISVIHKHGVNDRIVHVSSFTLTLWLKFGIELSVTDFPYSLCIQKDF